MARRRRREEEDDRDDRRDRRGGGGRGRGGGGSGTTVVVIAGVGCVLFLIGIFAFVNSEKGKKPKRKKAKNKVASQSDITDVSRGDTVGDDGGGASSGGGAKRPKLVSASCTGRWRMFDPGPGKSNPDPRKVELKCPGCRKAVTLGTASCSCGQPIEWPKSIKCGFCNGDGLCTICKDKEHLCPWCVEHPRGGMFGMNMGNCPMGCSSGKCPGCKGSGGCGLCKGSGKIILEDANRRGRIK